MQILNIVNHISTLHDLKDLCRTIFNSADAIFDARKFTFMVTVVFDKSVEFEDCPKFVQPVYDSVQRIQTRHPFNICVSSIPYTDEATLSEALGDYTRNIDMLTKTNGVNNPLYILNIFVNFEKDEGYEELLKQIPLNVIIFNTDWD